MAFERSIKVAFDRISGEVIQADEIFKQAKFGFEIRKQFHKGEIELYCCECEQGLNVSTSKYDRLHFKHKPKANPCLLKDNNLSPEEIDRLHNIYKSKESPRHKELKKIISEKLSRVNGIQSIIVDNKFIIDGEERRKPDVYCKYFDKELVFEIQLSDLSLRYIINRYEFYKRNKMYLIWILDNFDVNGQSQTERDIKYLTEFENFFKLDEKSDNFRLMCTYKYPFLTNKNKLLTKWLNKSVSLEEISFSSNLYQIYYFNYAQNKVLKEEERNQFILRKREEEIRQEGIIKRERANQKAEFILNQLRYAWEKEFLVFNNLMQEIEELNEFELTTLNNSAAFQPKGVESRIHYWFSIARKNHSQFLGFMLDCHALKMDVNQKSSTNKSLLNTLFENNELEHKLWLTKKILKRGYFFKSDDELLINALPLSRKECQSTIILCYLTNQLDDKSLIDKLFEHRNLICIIESAKRNEIIGFGWKPDEWIAFANNAIHSYKEYWEYIEIAFRNYGIWEKLISLDVKGTFQKKLENYFYSQPKQNFDCDRLFRELYTELNN